MRKKQYEKPVADKISFSIADMLMDTGTVDPDPGISGGGTGGFEPPPTTGFNPGFQTHP